MRAQFITAGEVAETLGVSRSKAYQIVRGINRELKAQGYLTIAAGVSAPAVMGFGVTLKTESGLIRLISHYSNVSHFSRLLP